MELVAIGDINWDTVLVAPRIPASDEEVEVTEVWEAPGGDAANVAVAFARLGGTAGMIGAVGTDTVAKLLWEHLVASGVDTSRVLTLEGPSGRAFSLVEPNGARRLFYTRGANALRKLEEDDLHYIEQAKWLYIADPLPHTLATLATWYYRKSKLPKLALDPGSAGAAKGEDFFVPLFLYLSVLFLNEGEALMLSGRRTLEEAVERLTEICPLVVIKRGENGALLATSEGVLALPAFPVKTVDTTGCGDAFNAAFLLALVRGKTLEEAGRWGNAAGALAAQRFGAYAPTFAELLQFLTPDKEVK